VISDKRTIETESDINTISNNINTETKIENEKEKEKTVTKKKIKKKIVKKKKEINLELPDVIDNKNEKEEYTHKKMNTNVGEISNEEKLNPDNDINNRAITENKEPKTEEKKKKPKKKIIIRLINLEKKVLQHII
jgi:hypothetical protein